MRYRSTHQLLPLDSDAASAPVAPTGMPGYDQTLATAILIPLLQNIIGGGAVAGLCVIGGASLGYLTREPQAWEVTLSAGLLLGGAVTCLVTVVRFFGDDIGLLRWAHQRGQASRQARVQALELELQAARTQLAQALGRSKAAPPTAAQQHLERIYAAAQHLVYWHFERLPIDRRSCERRNMAQSDWRRARHLLVAAGVMDEQGVCGQSLAEALAQTHGHYAKLATLGGYSESFVAPV